MADIRYVDPDDPWGDEQPRTKQKPKKLFGRTDLQKAALEATGRSIHGFRDNQQYKKFVELEENALGADDESRMWQAWIKFRIEQAAHFNKKAVNISLDQLIHRINMRDKREEWFTDNRVRVLRKKSPQELAGDFGADDMLKRAGATSD